MPRVCPVVITLAATARTRDLPDATGLSRGYHVGGYQRGRGTYLMPRACPVVITLAATARTRDLPDATGLSRGIAKNFPAVFLQPGIISTRLAGAINQPQLSISYLFVFNHGQGNPGCILFVPCHRNCWVAFSRNPSKRVFVMAGDRNAQAVPFFDQHRRRL